MPEKISLSTQITKKVLGEEGYKLTWIFNADELIDHATAKSIYVTAAKLCLWRKYPILRRIRFITMLSSAWIELCAFISEERGKLHTEFRTNVTRKFQAVKS